ncbi:paraquat-inducible protein A [Yoonia tamlensis]|uniref:Paraquat-inducible protein A n=1 Tax=Yoonia tamlensis TaxID=390270 RepID=A0A1I6GKA4_9RHOB|nr:paraquat-inducible protein A [Yoonia tamlensis]SFR42632.1 paraquat-inducible protein A [Yoonia tamlensis]
MQVFDLGSTGTTAGLITARNAGLVACQRCGQVHAIGTAYCKRCEGRLQSRDTQSLQKVWAWLIAGIIAYFPANIYPMLLTNTLVEHSESTIIGGAVDLMHHGAIGIALIVLFASVVIPIGKFGAIIYLALSVQSKSARNPHERHKAYELVEFIGRWSMIDVFVVAILSAMVQLNTVATINPGIAALSFALSVIFTMLSAQSFDSRLIWDADKP